jgi:hypothetical protein
MPSSQARSVCRTGRSLLGAPNRFSVFISEQGSSGGGEIGICALANVGDDRDALPIGMSHQVRDRRTNGSCSVEDTGGYYYHSGKRKGLQSVTV